MIELFISFLGFAFGLILSFIAPEELKPGKKYFLIAQHFLFFLIIIFSLFLFIYFKNYYFILIPVIYLPLFLLILHKKHPYLSQIFNYLLFSALYLILFFTIQTSLLIILPSLIFLYGLPTGTLVKIKHDQK